MTRKSTTGLLIAAITVVALATDGARSAAQPPPPEVTAEYQVEPRPRFDPRYLFAVTREMRDSSGDPAMVACLAPLTLVVDVFLLPVEAALGFFE
jgi:hypothetical protein